MSESSIKYLSTGIKDLDDILSPDRIIEKYETGGILLGEGEKREHWETPIAIIEGITGTGKTNMALQIAHAAARDKECVVFFYSLEQSVAALCRASDNFGAFQSKEDDSQKVEYIDMSHLHQVQNSYAPDEAKIHFCKFSPRPLNASTENEIFDQRVAELEEALFITKTDENRHNLFVFIIDGITAFAGKPLQRNEVYKIFSMFRQHHVPAIITSERYSNESADQDSAFHEAIKFLADIVICLYKETPLGHLLYYLEIIKSRVGRQALGKHLYKIRTAANAKDIKTDTRKGIVVYPSIHYVLSRVRARISKESDSGQQKNQDKDQYRLQKSDYVDLGLLLNAKSIKPNSSISIVGANGTHKLALALNFAMGNVNSKTKMLLLNFGGTGQVDFHGVAWTNKNKKWRELSLVQDQKEMGEIKFWHTRYGIPPITKKNPPNVYITSFKIGQLTPEECFDTIEYLLVTARKNKQPFHSVVLNNTAEICTGFPYLKNEPLFIPTLLDLFYVHNLVSVSIGVENDKSTATSEMNFALQANADYRIVLNHYPSIEQISEYIVTPAKIKKETRFDQQFVSILIDNVTGKHYMRHPRWLWVQEQPVQNSGKILHCTLKPKNV